MKPTFRAGDFKPDPKRDVREEIQAHIEMEAEGLMAQGMPEDEARAEAERLFGDQERFEGEARKEAAVRERRVRWLDRFDSLIQDLRFAFRRMAKSPGFTAVAILSLALGIGANTAIFSIVNTILLGGVPMRAPEELVEVYTSEADHGYPYSVSSIPDLEDLAARTDLFSGVVGYSGLFSRMETDESTEPVIGEVVSWDLFSVLGIEPALGRFFVPEEGQTMNTHPVVVLGNSFWRTRFGSDPGVVGQTIRLGGKLFTVVGVAPEEVQSFTAPGFAMDLWAPYQMSDAFSIDGTPDDIYQRGDRSVFVRARLQPGVTVEEARAALATMSAQNQEAYPDTWRGREFNILPTSDVAIHPFVDGPLKGVAALLLSMVGMVLLIACVNLAGFLLARASERRKEIALRLALGAKRSTLIRQLLTETLLLGLLGGGAGLLVANWVLRALVSFQPPIPFPINFQFGLDGRVLLFTVLVSAAAGLFFGLIPALQSTNPDVAPTLKDDSASGRGSRKKLTLRNGLVVSQVAISMVLLLGAGLFVRSLWSAQDMDIGFTARDGGIAWIMLGLSGVEREEYEIVSQSLEDRAMAIPGVERVTTAEMLPLGVGLQTTSFDIPGVEPPEGQEHHSIRYNVVSPTYFDVMEISVVTGRAFSRDDRAEAEPVAIVSEAAARRYWPGESPMGKTLIRAANEIPYRIVGVAQDTKIWTLGEEFQPYVYLPRAQASNISVMLVARGSIPDGEIAGQLRRAIRDLNPSLVIMETKTMGEHLSVQLFPPRAAAGLLGAFGLLALILATTGLYGTVAFNVSRRTREMGIRISLGADAGKVVGMVLRGAMGLMVVGGSIGLLLCLGLAQAVRSFLYGTSAFDPVTFIGVPAVLLGVAALAAFLPARRASRVNPVEALKTE
ncbi:ADOP family duplicated permease [Gemmatimonadota bacterium]